MSVKPRFEVARAQLGSPIVRDTLDARAVLVLTRNPDMPREAADAAAMNLARICTQALNRVHNELLRKQQEGGK